MPAKRYAILLTATLAIACAGQVANATSWAPSDSQKASSPRTPPDPDAAISVFRTNDGATIYISDDSWELWNNLQFSHLTIGAECPAWGYLCDELFYFGFVDLAAFEQRGSWIGRDGMLMQSLCTEPLDTQLPCTEGLVFWKYFDNSFGSFRFKVGYGVNQFMFGEIHEPRSDGTQFNSFDYFTLTNGLPLLSPERRSTPRVDPEAEIFEIWDD